MSNFPFIWDMSSDWSELIQGRYVKNRTKFYLLRCSREYLALRQNFDVRLCKS